MQNIDIAMNFLSASAITWDEKKIFLKVYKYTQFNNNVALNY